MPYDSDFQPIRSLAEEDRPREKLLLKGFPALSDAELIAILLGTGTREHSAIGLAQSLLKQFDHNLYLLAQSPINELQKVKGIGKAKAITVAAAMELGRRRQLGPREEQPLISSSRDAHRLLGPLLMDLPHEEFWLLMLNRANRVIKRERLNVGGLVGTVVDVRQVYQRALGTERTAAIIACHNHPSGQVKPSQADIDITRKLKEAGKILDIPLLDHLIIGGDKYLSMADEGLM